MVAILVGGWAVAASVGCSRHRAPVLIPGEWDRQIQVTRRPFDLLMWSASGRIDGRLAIILWPAVPEPADSGLDSLALSKRLRAREATDHANAVAAFRCTSWEEMGEYHGNLLSACVVPFVRGAPRWPRLYRLWDDYLARLAAHAAAGDPAGCELALGFRVVTWERWQSTQMAFSVAGRPPCSADSAAVRLRDEGRALVDSVIAQAYATPTRGALLE